MVRYFQTKTSLLRYFFSYPDNTSDEPSLCKSTAVLSLSQATQRSLLHSTLCQRPPSRSTLTMLKCLALILLQVINGTWSTAGGDFLPFSHSARPRPLSRPKQSRELIICQNWTPSPTSYWVSERVLSDHVRVWIKSLLLLVWQLTHKHTHARSLARHFLLLCLVSCRDIWICITNRVILLPLRNLSGQLNPKYVRLTVFWTKCQIFL